MHLPIYLDHASTTPLLPEVLEAIMPYFTTHFGNSESRFHAYGWLAKEAVEESKKQISLALNCNIKGIIFTSGATESINLVLKGFLEKNQTHQLLTFKNEHKATLDTAENLKNKGRNISVLEINKTGGLNLEILEEQLQNGPALVSVLWVNNETGNINDIKKLVSICRKYNSKIHVDATQAVGKVEIDFIKEDIDFLSYSAHKINGPKGVGVLLCKNASELSPQINGGNQQRGLRSGTLNVPSIVGIGIATQLAIKNLEENVLKVSFLQNIFEKALKENFKNITINAEYELRACHISNVCFPSKDSETMMLKLPKLAISNGSACNARNTTPSHVLTAMGLSINEANSCLRFSFGSTNTEEDVKLALDYLIKVVN